MSPVHTADQGARVGPRPGRAQGETVLGRLAGACYDRRRTVLALWILAIIGVTVLSQVVGTHFENKFTAGNTPSQQASNILQATFPSKSGDTADVVFHTAAPDRQPRHQGRHQPGPGVTRAPALRPEHHQPVLAGRRPPDRRPEQGQHRLRPGAVHDRHRRHPDRRSEDRSSRRRRPPPTTASRSSSAAARSRPPPPRRPGRARASASPPPSSSCCWPSGPSWPWACR